MRLWYGEWGNNPYLRLGSVVLDGGTGFLKVGYAAQVRNIHTESSIPTCGANVRLLGLIVVCDSEFPRTSIPFHRRPTNPTVRRARGRYCGEGYNVWR